MKVMTMKKMTGLEAIEFMKDGGKVVRESSILVYEIKRGN